MKLFIAKDVQADERRVALTPDKVTSLKQSQFHVLIESQAGALAGFSDQLYEQAGASICSAQSGWQQADVVIKVQPPSTEQIALMSAHSTIISHVWPAQNTKLLQLCQQRSINLIAFDAIPRISRAQKMDVLSSMANLAGYRAVIEAASVYGRMFTGQVTAAGNMPAAKILVIGAGVAGLAAIAAAKSMGAIVKAFDTRLEVKDQITSLGAEFLQLEFAKEDGQGEGGYAKTMSAEFIEAEMILFAQQAKEVDIIITTAQIPGKKAPLLLPLSVVEQMRPGSLIVDLAAEQGGNCELTQAGKVVEHANVTIIGYTNLPSRIANQASELFAQNAWQLLMEFYQTKTDTLQFDLSNTVIRHACLVYNAEIIWPAPLAPAVKASKQTVDEKTVAVKSKHLSADRSRKTPSSKTSTLFVMIAGALLLLALGQVAPTSFMSHFTVFVLACFVGWQVIWNVSHALHTPLMAVTNAISGIVIVGAILQLSSSNLWVMVMAFVAVLVASINIFGGFFVTHRMLKMFRRKGDK